MNDTTFNYTANDFAGNMIDRQGLTFRQLVTQVSNLVVSGYKMSIWTTGTHVVIPTDLVPPSWLVREMTDSVASYVESLLIKAASVTA